MNQIHKVKLGFAFGITLVLLYIACMLFMIIAGEEGTISFFNAIFHGLDTTELIRMDIGIWESLLGMILFFILGWLSGFCIAYIYNKQLKKNESLS